MEKSFRLKLFIIHFFYNWTFSTIVLKGLLTFENAFNPILNLLLTIDHFFVIFYWKRVVQYGTGSVSYFLSSLCKALNLTSYNGVVVCVLEGFINGMLIAGHYLKEMSST